jgi:hypothetical protein
MRVLDCGIFEIRCKSSRIRTIHGVTGKFDVRQSPQLAEYLRRMAVKADDSDPNLARKPQRLDCVRGCGGSHRDTGN